MADQFFDDMDEQLEADAAAKASTKPQSKQSSTNDTKKRKNPEELDLSDKNAQPSFMLILALVIVSLLLGFVLGYTFRGMGLGQGPSFNQGSNQGQSWQMQLPEGHPDVDSMDGPLELPEGHPEIASPEQLGKEGQ